MSLLELFQSYEADFERTYADDRWSRMEPYFSEDVVYRTYGAAGHSTEGRDEVFRRMQLEFDSLPRRCKWRRIATTSGPEVDDNRVLRSWVVTLHIDGAADLMIEGSERLTFEDDRITMIEEEPSELAERRLIAWMKLNGHVFGKEQETVISTI